MSETLLESEQVLAAEEGIPGGGFIAKLRSDLSGMSMAPLVILTLVWAVDQFDTQVYGNLLPEVSQGLHTSQATAEELKRHSPDRSRRHPAAVRKLFRQIVKRVRIVYLGMLVYAVVFLTGIATSVGLFLLARRLPSPRRPRPRSISACSRTTRPRSPAARHSPSTIRPHFGVAESASSFLASWVRVSVGAPRGSSWQSLRC